METETSNEALHGFYFIYYSTYDPFISLYKIYFLLLFSAFRFFLLPKVLFQLFPLPLIIPITLPPSFIFFSSLNMCSRGELKGSLSFSSSSTRFLHS